MKDVSQKKMTEHEWMQRAIRRLERKIRNSISEVNTIKDDLESIEEENELILKDSNGNAMRYEELSQF